MTELMRQAGASGKARGQRDDADPVVLGEVTGGFELVVVGRDELDDEPLAPGDPHRDG